MRRLRPARLAVPAAALCLLLLAACEDPSGVGLTVLDPSENDPRARTLLAEDAGFAPLEDRTGAFIPASSQLANFRGLAGRAADPVYGTVTATAFLDVLPAASLPEGFRDRPIREATLRLRRIYVYGDTLAPTRLDVHQIAQEWDALAAASDTLFPVQEGVITSFDVSASDSLVEVPLPASWVAANDTTLRSEQFSTLFHGFRLSAGEPARAVYGFAGNSTLELISAEDTVRYAVSEVFSNVAGPEEAPDAATLWRLQDGTGRGLELDFDVDSLGQAVLNTAFLRVNAPLDADSTTRPAGFVRPLARELVLYAYETDTTQTPAVDVVVVGNDGSPISFAEATLDEETQSYTFSSPLLTEILQDQVLDRGTVDGFVVGFPRTPSSLDVAPLIRTSSAGCGTEGADACRGPRAVVILIPTGE